MSQSEFDRLEQFVSRLLSKYDALRDENSRLERLLSQREEEISSLQAEISTADSERGDITKRVKDLLEQIEDWENALAESDDGESLTNIGEQEKIAEHHGEVEQREISMEEREDHEKDGGTQQNLFNVEPRTDSYNR